MKPQSHHLVRLGTLGLIATATACATTPSPPPDQAPTQAPRLLNESSIEGMVEQYYPEDLVDDGIGGVAEMLLFVDTTGAVTKASVDVSTGNSQLDSLAVFLAGALRFEPARNGNTPVAVWIRYPMKFSAND